MDSKGPKREWFACFVVNEKNFWIQDHTVSTRKSSGDEVLKMGHLKNKRQRLICLPSDNICQQSHPSRTCCEEMQQVCSIFPIQTTIHPIFFSLSAVSDLIITEREIHNGSLNWNYIHTRIYWWNCRRCINFVQHKAAVLNLASTLKRHSQITHPVTINPWL